MAAAAVKAKPPTWANVYNTRKVGTAKACSFCHKDTLVCLATPGMEDFFYACESHLFDFGFARGINAAPTSPSPDKPATPPPGVPQSEIDKVTKEYEERKKKRKEEKEAGKDKDKEADSKDAKGWLATGFSGVSSLASATGSFLKQASLGDAALAHPEPEVAPASPRVPPTQVALHRDIYAMRLSEAKRRFQAKEAKERAAAMPSVIRGLPSVPTSLP